MADFIDLASGPVDIAFSPRINDFNGRKSIQAQDKGNKEIPAFGVKEFNY